MAQLSDLGAATTDLHAVSYISVAESLGISSTTFAQCAQQATEFGEITQNKRHYAVQGH